MKRNIYITPNTETIKIYPEELMGIKFSQVDNDGDGKTDQQPIIEGDPEEIGAKPGFFSDWED
ncbi:hypothetical protein [Prevotella sp. KH2C16]|uniref:hypothetical protein n=1 Tax=Prevotella sp. KH2C16 TaxID=1855325 RepID=UPI0008EBD199|nr:hypothetical protein [Prevotella sp. KH2C16]SFG09139.1 hypothetical protein SAMN05216383_10522 [Prevotella sp. KH2C16]